MGPAIENHALCVQTSQYVKVWTNLGHKVLVFVPFQTEWVFHVKPKTGGAFDGVAHELLAFRRCFSRDADTELVTAFIKDFPHCVDFAVVRARICPPHRRRTGRGQGVLDDAGENDVAEVGLGRPTPHGQPLEVVDLNALRQVKDDGVVVTVRPGVRPREQRSCQVFVIEELSSERVGEDSAVTTRVLGVCPRPKEGVRSCTVVSKVLERKKKEKKNVFQ